MYAHRRLNGSLSSIKTCAQVDDYELCIRRIPKTNCAGIVCAVMLKQLTLLREEERNILRTS